jgi:hypothetical protein
MAFVKCGGLKELMIRFSPEEDVITKQVSTGLVALLSSGETFPQMSDASQQFRRQLIGLEVVPKLMSLLQHGSDPLLVLKTAHAFIILLQTEPYLSEILWQAGCFSLIWGFLMDYEQLPGTLCGLLDVLATIIKGHGIRGKAKGSKEGESNLDPLPLEARMDPGLNVFWVILWRGFFFLVFQRKCRTRWFRMACSTS